MAGYYDDATPVGDPPPREQAGYHEPARDPMRDPGHHEPARRSPVNANRLWAGGLATAVVAALVALVGILIVRAVLRIAVYAPREAGAFGDSDTVLLCVVAAGAALAATALAHLLIVATPSPLSYFNWIVGLATAAAVVLPLITGESLAVAFAQAVIHLVIGLAIGSLVTGAASSAMRTPPARQIDLR